MYKPSGWYTGLVYRLYDYVEKLVNPEQSYTVIDGLCNVFCTGIPKKKIPRDVPPLTEFPKATATLPET